MAHFAQSVVALIARVLLAAIFLMSGMGKIFDFGGTARHMESQGMVLAPLFLVGAILLELAGGLSLLSGWWSRFGAVALIIFLVPATLIFHDFWQFEGDARRLQQIMFLKNVAIAGGLLLIVAYGPGGLALDRRGPKPPRV